jgi:mono/diheme cytochrome c family protein
MLDDGNRHQRVGLLFLLVTFALIVCVQAFANREVLLSREQDLKPGDGREIVAKHCLVCHDATLITTPQLTPSQWNRTITEMIEEQGMEEPTPEVRQTILEYLVETQSPES